MKTNELSGAALDWAVAKCEGILDIYFDEESGTDLLPQIETVFFKPSTDWAQGGAIIERERIRVTPMDGYWDALYHDNLFEEDGSEHYQTGATPLEAAMRCYVASKLGDEVQIPEELK